MEAPRIFRRILADYQPMRYAAPAIEHNPVEPGVPADIDVGQHHDLDDLAIEVARTLENSSVRRMVEPETTQPQETIESIAAPLRSSSSKMNIQAGFGNAIALLCCHRRGCRLGSDRHCDRSTSADKVITDICA